MVPLALQPCQRSHARRLRLALGHQRPKIQVAVDIIRAGADWLHRCA